MVSSAQRSAKESLIPFSAAEKAIDKGEIEPIYLLAGRGPWADPYLRDRITRKIKDRFLGKESGLLSTEIFHAASDKPDIIINALATSSMFSDKKLILIHEIQRLSEEGLKKLGQYAADPIPGNCVILVSLNFDARRKWYNSLSSYVYGVKIETPFSNQIPSWINEFAKSRGKSISPNAAKLIAEYAGDTLQSIDMEMEKLSLYVGDKEKIDEDDVIGAIGFSRKLSPLDLEKYLAKKDLSWSLRAIDDMLKRGEKATSIAITMYNFLMNTLVSIEGGESPSNSWSPREQIKKDAVARWKRREIISGFDHVKKADFKIKQTGIPHNVIFSELVVQLLSADGERVV